MTNQESYFASSQIPLIFKYLLKRRLANPISQGSELVTNGDFSSATGWTCGTNISINTSSQRAIFAYSNETSLTQSISVSPSTWYRVEFDVLEYQQGNIGVKIGNESSDNVINLSFGHFKIDVRAKGNTTLYLTGKNFAGSISNITCKKLYFYENDWQDITEFTNGKTLSSVSHSLDYKSWEFGEIKQDNASLKFSNQHGEMSDEDNENSVFFNGYVRHYSKIKVACSFNKTDFTTIFEGLLDDRSASTSVESTQPVIENISAYSYTKLFSDVTLNEIGSLAGTTINALVAEIVNRGYFTDYFNFDSDLISAGYNAQIDVSEYDSSDTVMDVLSDLAQGHSVFYIDNNGYFNFKKVEANSGIKAVLDSTPERKIKVYEYKTGSERIIEKFYWEESTEIYESGKNKYNTSEKINIAGVTNTGDRQAILNFLGAKFGVKRISCKIDLPLCPFLDVMDRVKIEHIGNTYNCFILDKSQLDIGTLTPPISAIQINSNTSFVIYEVKHSNNKTTILVLEE